MVLPRARCKSFRDTLLGWEVNPFSVCIAQTGSTSLVHIVVGTIKAIINLLPIILWLNRMGMRKFKVSHPNAIFKSVFGCDGGTPYLYTTVKYQDGLFQLFLISTISSHRNTPAYL